MKWNDVRKRARNHGVNARNLKKTDLIRALQRAEGNFDCFGRSAGYCDQCGCVWRDDCLKSARRSA